MVAYKNNSMYLGRYVGPPLIWAWQRIPGDIGCSGPESVVVIGTQHFFIGPSDIYVFDGTVPRPIGAPVREWFFEELNATHRDKIVGVSDLARDLVYWYYPSTASTDGALDSLLVYNFRTGQWGKQAVSIQAAVAYSSGQVTYDGLGTLYSTYEDLPDIAYDSPFWLADSTIPGVFADDTLYSLTGEPGPAYMITGDFGDLIDYSMFKRATPRYRVAPADAQGTNYHRSALGQTPQQDATIAMTADRFDFRRVDRWHRLRIDTEGTMTINGLDVDLVRAGNR